MPAARCAWVASTQCALVHLAELAAHCCVGQLTLAATPAAAAPCSIDTPGEVFIGRVNKAESGRRVPSVEVQFLDDGQKYWFPVADVRRWMADMVHSGSRAQRNPGIPAPDFAAAGAADGDAAAGRPAGEDEAAAAKTLQSLSVSAASLPAASGAGGGGAQPAVSTGRQQRRASDARTVSTAAAGGPSLQRSGSEVKRVGALDIMATAADLGCANSPPAC